MRQPESLFEEYNRAVMLAQNGQNQEAAKILRGLLPDFEEVHRLTGKPDLLMRCLVSLASTTQHLPDLETALYDTKRVIELAQAIHDERREQMFSNNLVKLYLRKGEQALRAPDLETAMDIYKMTLNLARNTGDARDQGRCLGNIATIYSMKGDPQLALEFHSRALELFKAHGHLESYAMEYCNMGNAYLKLGQFQQAGDIYEEILANFEDVPEQTQYSSTIGMAICAQQCGEWFTSQEYYRRALDMARLNRPSSDVEFLEFCLQKADQRQKVDLDTLETWGFM